MSEVSSGWFLRFSPEEKQFETDLIAYMEEAGYPVGPEGIKKILSEAIYIEEEEDRINPIMDAIRENPEAIRQTFTGLGNLASQLINKKIFKSK